MKRGWFVSFEGGEGAGKTTNIALAKDILIASGIDVILTREPGGTIYAENIRQLLLAKQSEPLCPDSELLLVFAARAQHIEQVIKPALASGKWVLCDRFTDSSYAYQGYGREMPLDKISLLENTFLNGFKPDKTLLFDIEVEQGMLRAKKRASLDRFEDQELAFFNRVRQGFLARLQSDPQRFQLIEAAKELNEVGINVRHAVFQEIERWSSQ